MPVMTHTPIVCVVTWKNERGRRETGSLSDRLRNGGWQDRNRKLHLDAHHLCAEQVLPALGGEQDSISFRHHQYHAGKARMIVGKQHVLWKIACGSIIPTFPGCAIQLSGSPSNRRRRESKRPKGTWLLDNSLARLLVPPHNAPFK